MREALIVAAAVLLGIGITFMRFRNRYVPRGTEKLVK